MKDTSEVTAVPTLMYEVKRGLSLEEIFPSIGLQNEILKSCELITRNIISQISIRL